MTSRLLLTLLALLTGLSMQGTPVQARMVSAGNEAVGTVSQTSDNRQPSVPAVLCQQSVETAQIMEDAQSGIFETLAAVDTPSVLLRIDRARE